MTPGHSAEENPGYRYLTIWRVQACGGPRTRVPGGWCWLSAATSAGAVDQNTYMWPPHWLTRFPPNIVAECFSLIIYFLIIHPAHNLTPNPQTLALASWAPVIQHGGNGTFAKAEKLWAIAHSQWLWAGTWGRTGETTVEELPIVTEIQQKQVIPEISEANTNVVHLLVLIYYKIEC